MERAAKLYSSIANAAEYTLHWVRRFSSRHRRAQASRPPVALASMFESRMIGSAVDPYYKWLGIPPKDQPPNHYRLLALDLFEADRDAISNAADQRMMLVRSFQTGNNGAVSQKLLNELAAAKLCLLDANRKTVYDLTLRQPTKPTAETGMRAKPPRPSIRRVTGKNPTAVCAIETSATSTSRTKKSRTTWLLSAIGAGLMVLPILGISLLLHNDGRHEGVPIAATPFHSLDKFAVPVAPPHERNDSSHGVVVAPVALQFQNIPAPRGIAGKPLYIKVEVANQSRPTSGLQYFLGPDSPAGATIDAASGEISWIPSAGQEGHHAFQVIATDSTRRGETAFDVVVARAKAEPTIRAISAQMAAAGAPLRLKIETAEGNDLMEPLTYSLLKGPPGAIVNASTGDFYWRPNKENAGQQFEAKVKLADGEGRHAESSFTINVLALAADEEKPASKVKATPQDSRLSAPGQAEQQKATAVIRQLFSSQFAKARGSIAERQRLAETLIAEANKTVDDPAGQYVLYQEAAELAKSSVSSKLFIEAIDTMAKHFAVDAQDLKQQGLVELAKNLRSETEAKALTQALIGVSEEWMKRDEWDRVVAVLRVAGTTAPKARDTQLRKFVVQRMHEAIALKVAFAEYQESVQTLATDAADSAANRSAGLYMALIQGNWEHALPFLSKGDDETLSAAARKELQSPVSGEAKKEVADAWAELAATKSSASPAKKLLDASGAARENIRLHAIFWYQLAAKDLTGLSKRSVEQQIARLSEGGTIKGSGKCTGFVQILDDASATYAGTWTVFSGAGYNLHGNNDHYTAAGIGNKTATYSFTGLATGTYKVQATWFKYADRATAAPYVINNGTIQTVIVNQRNAPVAGTVVGNSIFQTLAIVTVSNGNLTVTIKDSSTGVTVADAVRIECQ